MNKQKIRTCFMVLVIACLFLLTGCKVKATNENAYKLPLGDSGYLSEIDFPLYYNNEEEIKAANPEAQEWYSITLDASTEYEIKFQAAVMGENYQGKAIRLSTGYYNNEEFITESDKVTYICDLTFADDNYFSYTFTTKDEVNENLVLKVEFGTLIDEEYAKENNSNISRKELKEIKKKYCGNTKKGRTTDIKIRDCALYQGDTEIRDVLTLVSNLGNVSYKINSDQQGANKANSLRYFNTATVNHVLYNETSSVITLNLNYKFGWWQWIIEILGAFLNWITKLVGGNYWLGILIFTIILRTAGWPIYAKSNSYTSNMQAIQPEMEKINKKYEGKTDQNSKMKQQMEIRALMKKNHVSMAGCLLPFLQMPIFFAVYQVVQRFPLTPIYSSCNYKFLWTSFALTYGQAKGDWILAIIVGVTMIGSQLLTMYMQKVIQRRHANFYTARNQSNNKSMLIMMAVMTVMMVVFAWSSAGIAFYWIIGNIYQIAQTFISKLQEEKKSEKKRLASGKPGGRQ